MASNESRTQSNLHQQDLTKLDIKKLSPLSPEVISRQATINIGTIGHVAHGKSTVVKAISGVQTVRFKNELERNITIKLERLPDAVLKMYQERAQENCELLFLEKLKNSQFLKKRKLSLESNELEDIEHKKKKNSLDNLEDNEYIIEKILDYKFQRNELLFYIKWKGWPDSDNTWEPIENLNNCQKLRRNFIHIIEEKYCEKFDKLKKEISKGDLLTEEKLLERFQEIEDVELFDIKDDLIIKLLTLEHFSDSNETHIADLVHDARNSLQMYVLLRKRCHQLMSLRSWEELINHVDKDKKITIENNVDLAGPPEGFVYINESIPGVGVTIPKEPPIGCECVICNCRSRTCCGTQGGFFAYTCKKILRVAPGTPIYECNKACKCSSDCCNRVVQSGRNVKLCIFKTPNGCGWGVRTDQKIKRGQFVCQYIGEVITFDEAEKRGREYDANGLTYLFDLDFNSVDNPYTIDAASLGNVSHFINHSCDPNLGVWAVWADCLDPNLPMLALFAIRDIEEGEELCFDYLQKSSDNNDNADPKSLSYTNGATIGIEKSFCNDIVSIPSSTEAATTSSSASPSKSRFEMQQENLTHLKKLTECKCGSLNCRKYLF